MSDLTSSVITPLRTSLNRLNLGLTTSKNSVSYFLRNSDTENCVAAVSPTNEHAGKQASLTEVLCSMLCYCTAWQCLLQRRDNKLRPHLTWPHTTDWFTVCRLQHGLYDQCTQHRKWGHLNQHRLSIGQFTVVCTDVHAMH